MLPSNLSHSNQELLAHEAELEQLAQQLPGLTTPVSIVHGTSDELVPFANAQFLLTQLSASTPSKLIRLEGVNHFLFNRRHLDHFYVALDWLNQLNLPNESPL